MNVLEINLEVFPKNQSTRRHVRIFYRKYNAHNFLFRLGISNIHATQSPLAPVLVADICPIMRWT